jgi:hypothetical protein
LPVPVKLADPPMTGGHVEVLAGRLIKVLSHSPLARPLPAVTLSALGLAGAAFVGLCATAPQPSAVTPPVLLPLTALARRLGSPRLPDALGDTLMDVSIAFCCAGLAMMLWANSHGWSPSPRKMLATVTAVVGVLVNITPTGSADVASYATYGRIAAPPLTASPEERAAAEQFDRLSALGALPDEVADIVVSGMRSGRFYILTSENRNDAVTRRGTEIVSGGPPAVPFP